MLDFKHVMKFKNYVSSYKNRSIFNDHRQGILVKNIINFTDDDLEHVQKSWDETEKHNSQALAHNDALKATITAQIIEFFEDLGLPTYAKTSHGNVIGEHAEFKTMMNQMRIMFGEKECPKRPELVSIHSMGEYIKPQHACKTLIEFVHAVKPLIEAQEQKKQSIESALLVDRKAVADEMLSQAKMRVASEQNRKEWYKSQVGQSVKIIECDYCDTWKVGSFKCSCGRTFITGIVTGKPGAWEFSIRGSMDTNRL